MWHPGLYAMGQLLDVLTAKYVQSHTNLPWLFFYKTPSQVLSTSPGVVNEWNSPHWKLLSLQSGTLPSKTKWELRIPSGQGAYFSMLSLSCSYLSSFIVAFRSTPTGVVGIKGGRTYIPGGLIFLSHRSIKAWHGFNDAARPFSITNNGSSHVWTHLTSINRSDNSYVLTCSQKLP